MNSATKPWSDISARNNMAFDCNFLQQALQEIHPQRYSKSRNFTDGAVTKLSPFISRGVVSTLEVWNAILDQSEKWEDIQTLTQQLVWREHFQHAIELPDIASTLAPMVGATLSLPKAIIHAQTGIHAIDQALQQLYETGYIHNHQRLYIAALMVHHGKISWQDGARWMYYHLLDADYASNTLSWQWVAGIGRDKKYVVNQDNINHYTKTTQKGTFWDVPYELLEHLEIPSFMNERETIELKTPLPSTTLSTFQPELPTLIYHPYHLHPHWHASLKANRILLLPPSHFSKWPMSEKGIAFIINMAQSIEGIQLWAGEWDELNTLLSGRNIYIQHHPLFPYSAKHIEPRDFVAPDIKSTSRGFFGYWKKIEKNHLTLMKNARSSEK